VIALVTGASSGIGEAAARNHAGDSWRARVADGGWENVGRTMALNFDAVVRMTEALLALLRASAPSSIRQRGPSATCPGPTPGWPR